MAEEYYLELTRTGIDVATEAVLGYMEVYKGADINPVGYFSTAEHGWSVKDNIGMYSHFRIGSYKMKHSFKGKDTERHCLRPLEQQYTRLLIHDAWANDPRTLLGCVAPRIYGSEADRTTSKLAMNKLFDLLGGYELGREGITLVVLNNFPKSRFAKDTITKEQWRG